MPADADAIWQDDTLNRQADAEFLLKFLRGRIEERAKQEPPQSFVLNLDASWGEGKTFFLTRFAKHIEAEGHLVAYVNAWQDDHADDPLLAVMSAITKVVQANSKLSKGTKQSLKKLASVGGQLVVAGAKGAIQQAAKRYIGEDAAQQIQQALGDTGAEIAESAGAEASKALDKIVDAEGRALFERFSRAQRSIDDFRSHLRTFVESLQDERKPPFFIFIDELDRCRPNYAIALLERVKHLFDIENVAFVLATDTKQLGAAVGAVYGPQFEGSRYLTRFFDRTYTFEEATRRTFVLNLVQQSPIDEKKISLPPRLSLTSFVSDAFDLYDLSLRDIEKAYDILRTCVSAWDLKIKVELTVLLPLIIGYQKKVPFGISDDFIREMSNLENKNARPWRLEFADRSRFSQPERKIVAAMEVFGLFVRRAQRALPDMPSEESKIPSNRWVAERFQEEFILLYNSTHYPGAPPRSAILRYPELVKSAGRLLPQRHEPQR